LPYKKIDSNIIEQFNINVDKIHLIVTSKDYEHNISKQEQVNNIQKYLDKMIYELYSLSPDDIKVIEEYCNKLDSI
jgi:hypothetical protein